MTMTSNDIMLRKKKKGKYKAKFIESGPEIYLLRQFDVIDISYANKTFLSVSSFLNYLFIRVYPMKHDYGKNYFFLSPKINYNQ